MNPQDLDKLFRDALGEGRAQPRPDSWARVAAGLPSAAANAPAKPKRRVLWYRYAAAASVVLAAAGLWRTIQAPSAVAPTNHAVLELITEANVPAAPSAAQPNRPVLQPEPTTVDRPEPSAAALPPVRTEAPSSSKWALAYLEPLERSVQDDAVPLLKRRVAAPEDLAVAEKPVPRYRQLASDVSQVWTAVNAYRSGEAQPQVTVEVHVPAGVLQRVQQTKMLAQNFNQSWSTFLPKRSL